MEYTAPHYVLRYADMTTVHVARCYMPPPLRSNHIGCAHPD